MKFNTKYISIFAIIFLIVSLYFNTSLFSRVKSLEKTSRYYERQNEIQDSIIYRADLRIKLFEKNIEVKNKLIMLSRIKIDSLKEARTEINIIYRDRIIEIKEYNNESIENYWQDEFKK